MAIIDAVGQALGQAGDMAWEVLWPLVLGFGLSAIIQALVSVQQAPITNLTNQQTALTAMNKQLSSIQTALQQLVSNAQALSSSSLFANAQTVTSNNSGVVTATANAGQGAVVGGYSVAVTSLATAAQKTFSFTSPAQADTVSIDGTNISLAAGASAQDLVNAVNSGNSDVWATVTQAASSANNNTATIVFSSRNTGQLSGSDSCSARIFSTTR